MLRAAAAVMERVDRRRVIGAGVVWLLPLPPHRHGFVIPDGAARTNDGLLNRALGQPPHSRCAPSPASALAAQDIAIMWPPAERTCARSVAGRCVAARLRGRSAATAHCGPLLSESGTDRGRWGRDGCRCPRPAQNRVLALPPGDSRRQGCGEAAGGTRQARPASAPRPPGSAQQCSSAGRLVSGGSRAGGSCDNITCGLAGDG